MKSLYSILSDVLEIDEDSITEDTSPDNVDTWDSLNGLILVTALESEFNIKFTMEEVTSVRRVAEIKEALRKHGVAITD